MSALTLHPLAQDYLDRLDHAGRSLPRSERRELVAEIRAHLSETIDPDMSDAEVLTVLDRLGDPDEIVEAEQPQTFPDDRRGTREWAAIFLLLFGGFVFGIGWIVGLILLWSSRVWTTADKLIGTFIVPGGLATAVFAFGIGAVEVGRTCSSGGSEVGPLRCTGGAGSAGNIAFFVLLAVCVVGPIFTSVYLARRAP
jgi:hypothetical protein